MTLKWRPIGGWSKCTHEAAAFESRPEYAVAAVLDQSAAIEWWLRNDPAVLRIPTPIGYLEPDFVYRRMESGGVTVHGGLEVKGDFLWDGEGSDARTKARAACEWARVATEGDTEVAWEFMEVLEQDALASKTFEELRSKAIEKWPHD